MNPVKRLFCELAQLRKCLDSRDYWRYFRCVAFKSLAIVQSRSLSPADLAMRGDIGVNVKGKRIVLPLDKISRILFEHDSTPTFGSVREMCAGNVYLRAFRPDLKAQTVVDLGSNRGLFLILAGRILESDVAIGVEPQRVYDHAFWALVEANGLDRGIFRRVGKFASSSGRADHVTMQHILSAYAKQHIDFLKCDIEGGEFDIFVNKNDFLLNVDNIAMELHPAKGNIENIIKELNRFNFRVIMTDQFGCVASVNNKHFLYASRTGDLLTAI